jgi:hypothetical protein
MCAWASVSQLLPHNSATLQFQILMSMQMDTELKRSRLVPLLVWWGHWKGGLGGWGPQAQKFPNIGASCLVVQTTQAPRALLAHCPFLPSPQNHDHTQNTALLASVPIHKHTLIHTHLYAQHTHTVLPFNCHLSFQIGLKDLDEGLESLGRAFAQHAIDK